MEFRRVTREDLVKGANVYFGSEGSWHPGKILQIEGDPMLTDRRRVWLEFVFPTDGAVGKLDFFGCDLKVAVKEEKLSLEDEIDALQGQYDRKVAHRRRVLVYYDAAPDGDPRKREADQQLQAIGKEIREIEEKLDRKVQELDDQKENLLEKLLSEVAERVAYEDETQSEGEEDSPLKKAFHAYLGRTEDKEGKGEENGGN